MAKKKVTKKVAKKKARRVTTVRAPRGKTKTVGLSPSEESDQWVIQFIQKSRDEADDAKEPRMETSKANWDLYHLRQDMSHKEDGQSQEVLGKQFMATMQISSFFQQSLVDAVEWFNVKSRSKQKEAVMKVKPSDMRRLVEDQLDKANFYSHVGTTVTAGLLDGLMISKVHGVNKPRPLYVIEEGKKGKKTLQRKERMAWNLEITQVRAQNYYPDPNPKSKLYEIENMWLDYHEIVKLSKGPDAIYDPKIVAMLKGMNSSEDEHELKRETNQQQFRSGHRTRIKLTEFWGTILSRDGEVIHENVVATVANDKFLIRKPTPNPFWHQESPYCVGSLLETPHAVWPKALMDAPTINNQTFNEIYNLILDGALAAAHDVKQVRTGWLRNAAQVADGVRPGQTLDVSDAAPANAKVIETVTTGNVPPESMSMLNLAQQEFNSSALTNDLRQGVMPARSVKATEVVEASQTITSIFNGVTKGLELTWEDPILLKSWQLIAQNFNRLDEDVMESLLGPKKATELLQLDATEVFQSTVLGAQFQAFGITQIIQKGEDFRKWTTLLQTIGTSPVLQEAFVAKYSFADLLSETMLSLDIREDKIRLPEEEIALNQEGGQQNELPGGGGPDTQSQQPQAGSLAASLGGGFGGPQPGSPQGANPQ